MKTPKFTPEHVAEAIIKGDGIISTAAKRLKCSRTTVANYIDAHAICKAAYDEARMTTDDLAESTLVKAMRGGGKEGVTAAIFWAKTRLRDRGFIERVENINRNIEIDMSKLTNEQLERIAAGDDLVQVIIDGYLSTNQSSG